jgi:hypothetical protein
LFPVFFFLTSLVSHSSLCLSGCQTPTQTSSPLLPVVFQNMYHNFMIPNVLVSKMDYTIFYYGYLTVSLTFLNFKSLGVRDCILFKFIT